LPTHRNSDERRAARHYRLRGYRILGTNVWSGGYELDLIVRRGRQLVFCEVKGKTGAGFGDPLEMVDEEKLRRLRQAAEGWLARNPACLPLDCRFEVVAVRRGVLERLTVL
jgi:putative endonuclease